eukprot:209178-Pelagomonas_calceolata.AAC.1
MPPGLVPVHMLLLLIVYTASFFCYGGLMAITTAPPQTPTPPPISPQVRPQAAYHPFQPMAPRGFPYSVPGPPFPPLPGLQTHPPMMAPYFPLITPIQHWQQQVMTAPSLERP